MKWPAWYDAGLVAELANIPIGTRRVSAGTSNGRHPSRFPGPGLEFAQYRGYQPGDDVRRVDWKLLARSDRFYIREADAETALPILVVVDATASMLHTEAGIVKFDRARAIAAALVKSAVRHGDLPSLVMLTTGGLSLAPSRDQRQFERAVDVMDRTVPSGGWPDDGADKISEFGQSGPCVVISDGYDPDNRLIDSLAGSSSDATILVLRAERETDMEYGEPVTLEDLETGARVTLTSGLTHTRAADDLEWQTNASKVGIDVEVIESDDSVAKQLRNWLSGRSGTR